MTKLLLDEHVSPRVATGLRARLPAIVVETMTEWRGGVLLGQADELILQEAEVHGFTFFTYDQTTIRPLLTRWADEECHHAGVIFVDERTIYPDDIGELIRSLTVFLTRHGELDWRDRVMYLERTGR